MQLVIRGVDESLIKEINERAKEQGLSRNQFIKNYISMIPYDFVLDYEEGYLEDVVCKVMQSEQIVNARLERLAKNFHDLYKVVVFASNVDEFELKEVVGQVGVKSDEQ